jgi:hypothetical protein
MRLFLAALQQLLLVLPRAEVALPPLQVPAWFLQ